MKLTTMSSLSVITLVISVKLATAQEVTQPTTTVGIDEREYRIHEKNLYAKLQAGYDKSMRPVLHHRDAVPVSITMTLLGIDEVDEKKETITVHGWLNMQWTDVNLKWNSSDWSGMKSLAMPADQIWMPDIKLFNGVGANALQKDTQGMPVVSSEGTVTYIPPVTIQARCPLNLKNFPFDNQQCSFKFGSWVYHQGQLNLEVGGDPTKMDVSNFHENREFELVSTSAQRNAVKYNCCPDTYVDVTFKISLSRRTSYTARLFMGPSILLAFLLPCIFILPPSSREKFILGVGVLLGHVLLFGQLESFVPMAYSTMPNTAIFFMANVVLVGLSLFVSAITMNIWHRSDRRGSVPDILRAIFLGICGRVFRVSREDFLPPEDKMNTRQQELSDIENVSEDRVQIVGSLSHLVTQAEWKQLASVLDRIFFVIYIFIAVIMAIAMRH